MRNGPLRTIALCATCAVLAGAGSAALADGGDGGGAAAATGGATVAGEPADGKVMTAKCAIVREGEQEPRDVPCPPPPDGAILMKDGGPPDGAIVTKPGGPHATGGGVRCVAIAPGKAALAAKTGT